MSTTQTCVVGARGTVVLPAAMRKRLGIEDGSLLMLECTDDGRLIIRRAVAVPVEKYTAERKAGFLLNSAMDAEDYAKAVAAVRAMGLDPDRIPHDRPA